MVIGSRCLVEKIYEKYNIRVLRWLQGIRCETESTVPRSYFDFQDSLDLADEEIRYLLDQKRRRKNGRRKK